MAARLKAFPLGRVVATPGALQALAMAGADPSTLLDRHASNDWGEVCREDARLNDESLLTGGRLLSSFQLPARLRRKDLDHNGTCR